MRVSSARSCVSWPGRIGRRVLTSRRRCRAATALGVEPLQQAAQEILSVSALGRAAELDVVLALTRAALKASSQVWTLTPTVMWSESVLEVIASCSQPRGR